MKTLYLLRHAKSGPPRPGLGDFDRTLNERGRQERDAMAAYCEVQGIKPELVLCSSAVRTRETAEPFIHMWGGDVQVVFNDRIYESAPVTLLECLAGVSSEMDRVMLIGHNPGIHSVALHLSTPNRSDARRRLESKFSPGSLCELQARDDGLRGLEVGAFDLIRFVSPGDFR